MTIDPDSLAIVVVGSAVICYVVGYLAGYVCGVQEAKSKGEKP